MKRKFHLTYKPVWKLLICLGIHLIIIIFFGEYLYELKYGRGIKSLSALYIIGVSIISIILFPSLLITISYLIENRFTYFIINERKNQIDIIIKGETKTYSLDQIKSSIYHRQSYQKDKYWNTFSCYSDLGYLDISFKNNDRFYFTSFLVDIYKKPILENTQIKYSFLPFINKANPSDLEEKENLQSLKQIEKLKNKFTKKTINELREIQNDKSKYSKEAIIAIEEVLKKKNNL